VSRKKKKKTGDPLRGWKDWLAGTADPPSAPPAEPDTGALKARAFFQGLTDSLPSSGSPDPLCALAELLAKRAAATRSAESRDRDIQALAHLASFSDRRVSKAARTELHRLRTRLGKSRAAAIPDVAARPVPDPADRAEADARAERPALMNAYDSRLFCLLDLTEPDFQSGESIVLTTRLSPLAGVGTAEVLTAPRRTMRRAVRDRLSDPGLNFTEVGFGFGLSVLRRAMAVHHRSAQPVPPQCTRFLNMLRAVPEPSETHDALRLYPDPPAVDPKKSDEHLEHPLLANFTPPLEDEEWKRLADTLERGSESGLVLTGHLLEERRAELLVGEIEKNMDETVRTAFAMALLDTAFLLNRADDDRVGGWCVGVARLFEDPKIKLEELAFVGRMTLRALALITAKQDDESRVAAPGVLDGSTPQLIQTPGSGPAGPGPGKGPGAGGQQPPPGGLIVPGR
jgi:hypothetical protein